VRLDRDGDAWTVRCGGELDGAAAWHLSDALELCLDAKPASVVMDCQDVTFVDSGGFWALLRASRESFEREVTYKIVLSDQIRGVLIRAGMLERLLAGPSAPAASPA
jgi:anti-anti-sigma factor